MGALVVVIRGGGTIVCPFVVTATQVVHAGVMTTTDLVGMMTGVVGVVQSTVTVE